jgi:hypothetical protein
MVLCPITTVLIHVFVLRAAGHEKYGRLVTATRTNPYAEAWVPVWCVLCQDEQLAKPVSHLCKRVIPKFPTDSDNITQVQ